MKLHKQIELQKAELVRQEKLMVGAIKLSIKFCYLVKLAGGNCSYK